MNLFTHLELRGWRQFREVRIDFHPRLTVLTGANGAGKTTLLSLVSRHFGWQAQYVSTPRIATDEALLKYVADLWAKYFDDQRRTAQVSIGSITYGSGARADLQIPREVGSTYEVSLMNQEHVEGLHIPSHRPLYAYQAVASIPTSVSGAHSLWQQYSSIVQQKYRNEWAQRSPNSFLKETLIALATFGFGNAAVTPNTEYRRLFEEFQEILRKVLPPKIGFQTLSIRIPEVVLETRSGHFSLDAVSGGIASIIDIAWQIFMFSSGKSSFAITIDEPENHLHPELQRTLLGSLLAAFPRAQFVVATHNPFIVGSVPDSSVYVLDFGKDNKVSTAFLDATNRAGSANDILREVLGLASTTAPWVEQRLADIVARYSEKDIDEATLAEMRRELGSMGMDQFIPQSIASVVKRAPSR